VEDAKPSVCRGKTGALEVNCQKRMANLGHVLLNMFTVEDAISIFAIRNRQMDIHGLSMCSGPAGNYKQ